MKRLTILDNLRGFLILNVVLVHYIGVGFVYTNKSHLILDALYFFQVTFHMPLFAFISGLLSKDVGKCHKTAVVTFLVPYLLMNTIYNIAVGRIGQIFLPYGIMWYLLALFLWRYFLIYVRRVKRMLIIILCLAVISRFIVPQDYAIVIKIFTITPFFLLGYLANIDVVRKIRLIPKYWALLMLACGFFVVLAQSYFGVFSYKLPLFTTSLEMNLPGLIWLLGELASVMIGVVVSVCVVRLLPDSVGWLTRYGKTSFQIFLFHNLPYLRESFFSLNPFSANLIFSFFYWMSMVIAVTFLLSSRVVVETSNKLFLVVKRLVD